MVKLPFKIDLLKCDRATIYESVQWIGFRIMLSDTYDLMLTQIGYFEMCI